MGETYADAVKRAREAETALRIAEWEYKQARAACVADEYTSNKSARAKKRRAACDGWRRKVDAARKHAEACWAAADSLWSAAGARKEWAAHCREKRGADPLYMYALKQACEE